MKATGRLEPQPWMDTPQVRALFDSLDRAGVVARFVGGCVRDAVLDRAIDDIDLAVDKPPETIMQALAAADLKVGADRPEARHGDGDRRGLPVRAHDLAPRRRDRRSPRRRGLHRRLARGREPARLHLQRPLRRSRRHALRSVRRPERPRGGPRALHRRRRHRASPRTGCACCASSASTPGMAARRSTDRASRPAGAMPARSAACRANASPRNCCVSLEAPAPADALAGDGRSRRARSLAAGICRRRAPRGPDRARRRARSAAPAGGDPAGRRRCHGDRQAAEALDPAGAAPRSHAGVRRRSSMSRAARKPGGPASIALATTSTPTACCWPSTRRATGGRRSPWRAAGRRRNCR